MKKARGLWIVLIVLVLLSIVTAIGIKYNRIIPGHQGCHGPYD